MGQQTPELHPNAHPPLSHLSLAAPGLQPGPRSGSAREGASLYCLSASLGTWPLSSQLEMEPVPPALGGWSLIHRTTREVPKKELFSAQVGCSLLPGLMCALLPHVAAGAPTAGSSETGCPPAQPHTATPTAPPGPGVADCDLRGSDAGCGCGPGPVSWAQSLVHGSQDHGRRSPPPGSSHRVASEYLGLGVCPRTPFWPQGGWLSHQHPPGWGHCWVL